MKKVLTLFTIILASLVLVSCKVNKYDDFYTVVYYTNNIVYVETMEVEKDSTIKEPPAFEEVEGITFDGWYKDMQYKEEFKFGIDKITESITLYAKWVFEDIKITYVLEADAVNNKDNPETFTRNDRVIQLKEPTREGYTFRSWHTDPNLSNSSIINRINPKEITSDITLYPRWRKN